MYLHIHMFMQISALKKTVLLHDIHLHFRMAQNDIKWRINLLFRSLF